MLGHRVVPSRKGMQYLEGWEWIQFILVTFAQSVWPERTLDPPTDFYHKRVFVSL